MVCGDCGDKFKLVSNGRYQCPCGNWYKKKERRPLSEELKPYLGDMRRHEIYHKMRGGC